MKPKKDLKKEKISCHENGQCKFHYQINSEGEKDGFFKAYYDNGQLHVEASFDRNIQNPGKITSFHKNGKKSREVILDANNKYSGAFSEWHENGTLKKQGHYFDNKTLIKAVRAWIVNPEKIEEQYGHISGWNTSQVTWMDGLFSLSSHRYGEDKIDYSEFNENISNWDVSNVISMRKMFHGASSFNQNISSWDVSNVTDMYGLSLIHI